MLNSIFIFIVLIATVDFFTISIFEEEFIKYFQLIVLIVVALVTSFKYLFQKQKNNLLYKNSIIIIIVGVLVSAFGAQLYFGQKYFISFVAQRYMYFFIFYFFLHHINYPVHLLIKQILVIAILFCVVYLIASFNHSFVSTTILEERGTVRISLPGVLYIQVALFYLFEQALAKLKVRYFLFASIFMVTIIATGTRTLIFPTLFILFLMVKHQFEKGKKSNAFFMLLFSISVVFAFFSILENILLLLFNEIYFNEGNAFIRMQGIKFYFANLFPTPLSYLIGNGIPSELTNYGKEVRYFKTQFGLYQSDLGILGDYMKYGVLFVVGALLATFKGIKMSEKSYLKYSIYYIGLTLITISHFGTSSHIALITSLYYILEKNKN